MLRTELKVVGGKQHDKIIALPQKKFLVGREQDCHLRPNSESVSRHHCVFTIDDYSVRLRDLGSTNGTFVNDNRIHGQVELHSNDRILIGKLGFVVLIHDTAEDDANQAADAPPAELLETNGAISSETMLDLPVSGVGEAVAEKRNVVGGATEIITNTIDLTEQPNELMTAAAQSETAQPETAQPAELQPVQEEQPVEIVSQQPEPAVPESQPEMQPQPVEAAPAMQQPAMQQPQMPQQPMMQPQMPMQQPMYQPQPMYQQPMMPQQTVPPDMLQQQLMQQYLQQQMLQQQQMAQPMMPMQQPIPQAPQPAPQEPVPDETAPPKATSAAMPYNLPPPESTGIHEPPPTENSEKESSGEPAAKPDNPAAEIIKQYMNRRGNS